MPRVRFFVGRRSGRSFFLRFWPILAEFWVGCRVIEPLGGGGNVDFWKKFVGAFGTGEKVLGGTK